MLLVCNLNAQQVTMGTLLKEMIDRELLAIYSDQHYATTV